MNEEIPPPIMSSIEKTEKTKKKWDKVDTSKINIELSDIAQKFSKKSTDSGMFFNFSTQRKEGDFCGLTNQGSTCYLNSLLQSLYMTPEFLEKLYSFKYDPDIHGKEETCIPLQLQILFAKLYFSKKKAIGTKEITKSFGWFKNILKLGNLDKFFNKEM
jgi:ubiquitin C-terminal hydrolase